MTGDKHSWDQNRRYKGPRDYASSPRSPAEVLEPGHAPEPPDGKREKFQQNIVFRIANNLVMSLLILAIAGNLGYIFLRGQFDEPGPLAYDEPLTIAKGAGAPEIAALLQERGIVADRVLFIIAAKWFQKANKLKAGDYSFKKSYSIRQVLDTLIDGKTDLLSISIPEGMTSYQVVERVNAQSELTGKIDIIPPEGSLMPDTYRYARGGTREDLLLRMQKAQEHWIDEKWEKRALGLPFKTKLDAVNLAAIVEKETGQVDERKKVAAVYINRLKKNMALQADPTIIYGLSGRKGSLGRPISKADMGQDTPYNTYMKKGLPPTPIANPGRPALEAVLHPDKTNDIYFVANGTGGHTFSETYDQHLKAVAIWREVERKAREAREAREAEAAKAETAKADAAKSEAAKAEAGKTDAKGKNEPSKPEPAKPDANKPDAAKSKPQPAKPEAAKTQATTKANTASNKRKAGQSSAATTAAPAKPARPKSEDAGSGVAVTSTANQGGNSSEAQAPTAAGN